ncbi:MAG: hypothetical protein AMJ53_14975, partial [Gammaproteobacteria bacterium SG8_11]
MKIYRGNGGFILLSLLLFFAGCSGGGIDGSGGTPPQEPSTKIEGTAAIGSPLRDCEVTIKGAKGKKKQGRTDNDGKFSIDVKELEAPYLIKASVDSEKRLYSLAPKTGVSNIHPYSDVVARNWFKSRHRDIDAEFDSDTEIENAPLTDEIEALISALQNLLKAAFDDFSVTADFDIQRSRFDANSTGFDLLLDHSLINIKQGKITIKLVDPDPESKLQVTIILDFDLSNDLSEADAFPPTTPDRLVVYPVNSSQAIVAWNPSEDDVGVAGYRVYRDDNAVPFPVTTAFPMYVDGGLTAGSTYCYTVEAFDSAGGVSPQTDEVCVTMPDTVTETAPDPVTNLTATANSDSEISLLWTPSASDDVIGYDILSGEKGAVSEKIASVVSSSYLDFNLDANSEYCYIVKAFNATGLRSTESEEVCASTSPPPPPPNAPSVTGATPTNNVTPTWTWTSGGGGNGLYRYKLDDSDLAIGAVETSATSFTPSSALAVGTHTLYVQESNNNGDWSASGSFAITITEEVVPLFPPIVTGSTPTYNEMPTWSWTSGGGGNGTYRYKLDDNNLDSGAVETTATSFTPGTPLAVGTHTLYVQESNNNGDWSDSGSFAITILESADGPLAVDVSVLSDPVAPAGRAFYSITVSNTSFVTVNDVRVTFQVPAGILFSSFGDIEPGLNNVCSANICNEGEQPLWIISSIPAGGSKTIHLNAQVLAGQSNGTLIAASVSVTANEIANPINIDKTVVVNDAPGAQLAISADRDPVMPGETYTLNVDMGNNGGAPLSGTELRVFLPTGATVIDNGGGMETGTGEIVWDLSTNDIAVGAALHREVVIIAPDLAGTVSTDQLKARAQLSFT